MLIKYSINDVSINDDHIINSSYHPSINESITHSKSNRLTIDNISKFYTLDGITFGLNILNKYSHILKSEAYLITIEIDKSLWYRPEYVSKILYGTTDLWYLILFINNLKSEKYMNFSIIKVFNPTYITIINEIMEKEKNNLNTSSTSTKIKRSIYKELNKPSEKILSDRYDKKINPYDKELIYIE